MCCVVLYSVDVEVTKIEREYTSFLCFSTFLFPRIFVSRLSPATLFLFIVSLIILPLCTFHEDLKCRNRQGIHKPFVEPCSSFSLSFTLRFTLLFLLLSSYFEIPWKFKIQKFKENTQTFTDADIVSSFLLIFHTLLFLSYLPYFNILWNCRTFSNILFFFSSNFPSFILVFSS